MTDSEQSIPVIEPQEGETYMQAHERMLKEAAGITPDVPEEVLGVLTGQVPVRSAPIAMAQPQEDEPDSE
ncbi:MAG: hypothetical protein ACRER5_16065 [Pseudomonas sp.]